MLLITRGKCCKRDQFRDTSGTMIPSSSVWWRIDHILLKPVFPFPMESSCFILQLNLCKSLPYKFCSVTQTYVFQSLLDFLLTLRYSRDLIYWKLLKYIYTEIYLSWDIYTCMYFRMWALSIWFLFLFKIKFRTSMDQNWEKSNQVNMILFLKSFQLIKFFLKKNNFPKSFKGLLKCLLALKLRNTLSLNVVVIEIILIDITWKISSGFLQTVLSFQIFLIYYSLFLS